MVQVAAFFVVGSFVLVRNTGPILTSVLEVFVVPVLSMAALHQSGVVIDEAFTGTKSFQRAV